MRALVVEDETKIAAEIAATLSQAGYVVETVGDGEEAWLRGETEDFDGIILDLGLPKLDGLSVVRNLRAAAVTTPILILTARGAWTERVAGIDAGADDYLPNRSNRRNCSPASARSSAAAPAIRRRCSRPASCASIRAEW